MEDEKNNIYKECPICLDEKQDIIVLLCGHELCRDCKKELIEHNVLNKCPLCRTPLNWIGFLEKIETEARENEQRQQVLPPSPQVPSQLHMIPSAQLYNNLDYENRIVNNEILPREINVVGTVVETQEINNREEDRWCFEWDNDTKNVLANIFASLIIIIVIYIILL